MPKTKKHVKQNKSKRKKYKGGVIPPTFPNLPPNEWSLNYYKWAIDHYYNLPSHVPRNQVALHYYIIHLPRSSAEYIKFSNLYDEYSSLFPR